MHVVTHLLAGWLVADGAKLQNRDRAIVTWACVVPDIDGIGMVVDATNRLLGRADTTYYETYHHFLGHGLFAAIIATTVACSLALEKRMTALLACLTFHMHLVMDLAGSRGSNPVDIWPIDYLAPFSEDLSFSWNGQWPLTGWQNTSITIVLMAICIFLAVKREYSPIMLFSKRADAVFIQALSKRFNSMSNS